MTTTDLLAPDDTVSSDTLGQLVTRMERMILSGELP